ncbi:hypothetical protein [Bosea vaviloviae]|uniref:Uncharacterized protein n=1 Tax=Bosea vaviloviae TaxID=1526658 RepID=A0A0N1F2Z5_9HYPH|nr:hypothetical protein [Bosea vaviloviae]KPH79308.1 hypothetical protein AE618_18550 [Bosea vaviloviae]
MTATIIGPTFGAEIEAAGLLGQPFAWSADGVTYDDRLTADQRAAIEAVVAAHDPSATPATPAPRLSFLEFMDLFTEAEQLAIAGAAMTNVATKLWYDRAVGAQFIDLADARLTDGLQAMVAAGLLTSARRTRVLKGLAPAA